MRASGKVRALLTFYRHSQELTYTPYFGTKHPILLRIEGLCKYDPEFNSAFRAYEESYIGVTFLYSLQAVFYEKYLQMASIEEEDCVLITTLPEEPHLTAFQWQMFELGKNTLLRQNDMVREVMQRIYP